MQAIIFRQHGNPTEVLEHTTRPEPSSPGDREVLVRVTRLPIHSGDIIAVNGLHNPRKYDLPDAGLVPGAEGCGVVEMLGSGLDRTRGLVLGARVSFFVVGAWQERLILPADSVFTVPADIDDDLASQLYVNPMAAMLISREVDKAASRETGLLRIAASRALFFGAQPKGNMPSFVLLSAAGSVTAKLIAALLREKRYIPIGLVRSKSGASSLTASTGIQTVATEDIDWKDQVHQMTREGRTIAALDAVGGSLSTELLDLIAPGGTLLSYGILSGQPLIIPQAPLTMENKLVYGVGMVHWSLLPYDEKAADLSTMTEFLQRHRGLLPTCAEFKFSEINRAIELFGTPGRSGIIFLSP